MKKFKFLPSIIMLVISLAVLAVGIYAAQPTQNTIEGSITINAVNTPVAISVFIDSTESEALVTYSEIRHGTQIKLNELLGEDSLLEFNNQSANTLDQVAPRKVILRVTNLATDRQLGAYYLKEELSATTLIKTSDKIYDNTNKDLALANVTLPSYTILDANNAEKTVATANKDLEIRMDMATWEEGTGKFKYHLYLEEYAENIETYYEKTTGSAIIAGSQTTDTLSTLPNVVALSTGNTISSTNVVGIDETHTNVVIAEGADTIAAGTFKGNTLITSVIFPNTLTTIADGTDGAFQGCKALASVTYSEGLTIIGGSAFCYCSALTEISIPSSVIEIKSNAFFACNSLTSLTISENVTAIGYQAFYYCSALSEVNYNATRLTTQPTFSSNIFGRSGGSGGITVNIGANVEIIPDYLFFAYEKYEGDPDGLYLSANVSFVNFADNSVCASIGVSAFQYCDELVLVTIPKSITEIQTMAFYNCTKIKLVLNLSSLNIVAGETNNGYIAYYSNKVFTSQDGVIFEDNVVYSVTKEEKIAITYWYNERGIVIADDCTAIADNAFVADDYTENYSSITIPASVKTISASAFGWNIGSLEVKAGEPTTFDFSYNWYSIYNPATGESQNWPGNINLYRIAENNLFFHLL